MPLRLLFPGFILLLNAFSGFANVEKVVFLAPEKPSATLDALRHTGAFELPTLSLLNPSLRRQIHSRFPTDRNYPNSSTTWLLLSSLEVGVRYEVRICWSATVSSLRRAKRWL